MKIFCSTGESNTLSYDPRKTISLFKPWDKHGDQYASVGNILMRQLRDFGLKLTSRHWDLITIVLSALASDYSTPRNQTSDGWTRQFELTVEVNEPDYWQQIIKPLEQALQFLTTDIWKFKFIEGAFQPIPPKQQKLFSECGVVLLSGGLDSLVGVYEHRNMIAVSQSVPGDNPLQQEFAKATGVRNHLSVNHAFRGRKPNEDTQRSRSLFFLIAGIMCATHTQEYINGNVVKVMIPENGFIALNPPMSDIRIGALSTRTAHPYYLGLLEQFVQKAGIHIEIDNPYRLKTKGEMLLPYTNDRNFQKLAFMSTSCSGFRRHKSQHCGRCIPCQIRRAAFKRASIIDETKKNGPLKHKAGYLTDDLTPAGDGKIWDDVRAVQLALAEFTERGVTELQRSILSYPAVQDRDQLEDVIRRGLLELDAVHQDFQTG